ncbi:hypothetical protein [Desulfosporosinus lacus]|uniref:Nif11-like leader peptide domain-containing protein n=1 Tax=Desulfosporosinus lacus DSM 15449 TaxID=1121420 RepID=A0A1M5QY65_9FIRM|nr:hypothetical protein [Desulfosporosinus lacus]SHH18881.1 hypothetical protein SAMN02746098_00399 [Desulfosporosinus lacus DSM 15449]
MDINKFMESLGEKKEELLIKGTQCTTAEELMALAVENGLTLDRDSATVLLELMQLKTGELSDDELDSVAGGFFDKGEKSAREYGDYPSDKHNNIG